MKVHDLYIGEEPASLGGNVPSEWDHGLTTSQAGAKIHEVVRTNPIGEQLHICLRTYEDER